MDELDKANRLYFSIQNCDDWAKESYKMPMDDKVRNELILLLEKIRIELQKDLDKL